MSGALNATDPSQTNAKRFYDDKVRDAFDFLEHTQRLASLLDKSDTSVAKLIGESRERILKQVQADGYEDADETFQRGHEAAATVGQGAFSVT